MQNVRNVKRKKKKKNGRGLYPILALSAILILIIAIFFIVLKEKEPNGPGEDGTKAEETERESDRETGTDPSAVTDPDPAESGDPAQTDPPVTERETEPETVPETEPETEPPVTFSEITVKAVGDLMFHLPQVQTAYLPATGAYDFSDVFGYVRDDITSADLAVMNFETTLSGPEYPYQGFPAFNSPDSSLEAVKNAGFDLMLFANNHTYDNGLYGVKRTVAQFKKNGLSFLGAKEDPSDPTYGIMEIGGIKLGMINFADDLGFDTVNRTINGRYIPNADLPYIDLYTKGLMNDFYAEAGRRINELRDNGADLILFFIHWGDEYYTSPNAYQKETAQKLCDLGVDAIIGSHPHVVQPIETLTSSTDPSKKTICFYSLGNYVSNQCRDTLSSDYCHGNNKNTEMGLTVTLTVRKYSTGECMISAVDTMTTWVHRYYCSDGFYDYRILPAEKAAADPGAYGLNDASLPAEAVATVGNVIGEAVEAFNAGLVLPDGIRLG